MLQKVPATSRQGLLLLHFKHSEVKGGGSAQAEQSGAEHIPQTGVTFAELGS